MEEEFKILIDKYRHINKLDWIQSTRKGPTGIGKTFEDLLGKEEETFCFPDFLGIEIKTKRSNTNEPYSLFCIEPDGENMFEGERIRLKYGYSSKKHPQFKVFNHTIRVGKETVLGDHKFTLKVDLIQKRLYLIVYDLNGKIIDQDTYWNFDLLKEALERKLKNLAIIKAHIKFENNIEYFKYYKMYIFKGVNFNSFLKLLQSGKIAVNFKLGVYTGEYRYGQPHNHGTGFSIYENYIKYLYEEFYIVNEKFEAKGQKKTANK